jgi:hypothetical protein
MKARSRYKRTAPLGIALGVVLFCSAGLANPTDRPLDMLGAPYCTEAADLNRTTSYWLQRSLERFFNDKQFSDRFEKLGIDPLPDLRDLRLLTNRTDSVICERIRSSLGLERVALKHDIELQRTVPEYVVLIYALPSGGYFAYVGYYDAGSSGDEIGPPDMSRSSGVVFDANLRKIGSTGL